MKRFGLVGKSLEYSFSQQFFSEKFKTEQLKDCIYENFELKTIQEFTKLSKSADIKGLNITIPYKESVIPYVDELDETAAKINAVNTIHFSGNGRLKGYNTDIIGFRNSIKPFLDTNHTRALIFGTGGASKAIAFVLEELQIPYYFVSRTPKGQQQINYTDLDKKSIESFKFLINCTPLGTFPKVEEHIPIDFNGITEKHFVYDLVYNPEESILLKEAKRRNAIAINGLSMLKQQAEASWKIWNNN